ncbi:hypothetical protein [Bacterioplanoides pacificum]|uniref:Uncharacterized protein n=1 Tax=Bacterioplanoides pacificum TaxID=1171596 RepID=A0ABV7VU49_9GAMM
MAPEHHGGMEKPGDWVVTHHKVLLPVTAVIMLAFSAFHMNADMGIATALISFVALLVDFLFLPAFLLLVDKRQLSVRDVDGAANHRRVAVAMNQATNHSQ